MDLNSVGEKIVGLIRKSEMKTEPSLEGFIAFFEIDGAMLQDEEKELLGELMVGSFCGNKFKNYIADNYENPIIFDTSKNAFGTLMKEGKSVEKRFQFSLFSEKGVMIKLPVSNVVSFVPKKKVK